MNTWINKTPHLTVLSVILFISSFSGHAQGQSGGWRLLQGKEASFYPKTEGISHYQLYVLDTAWLAEALENQQLIIPDPQNQWHILSLKQSNLLAPALLEKFPDLHVLEGQSDTSPHFRAKLNTMKESLHVQVFQNGKLSYYIDPLGTDYPTIYLVYFVDDISGKTKLDERH